jgi:hypothetical protein
MKPDPNILIDPVAPTKVYSIGSRVEQGVVVKSHTKLMVTVMNGAPVPMILTVP